MRKSILGIDFGTSSVKILRICDGKVVERSRAAYPTSGPEGWLEALRQALRNLHIADTEAQEAHGKSPFSDPFHGSCLDDIAAIGLSSQVGTYLINDQDIISWSDPIGRTELDRLKSQYTTEEFIQEIGMPHPEIISYPLPRLLYIRDHYPSLRSVCQPKDWILEQLTGRRVTDPFSWRGLAQGCHYSTRLLLELSIPEELLSPLANPTDLAGMVSAEAAAKLLIPEGVPVYVGMNDFYCSLLGMGMCCPGDAFDITGTSEHLGILQSALDSETVLVSSPYLDSYVHYGVTASSGASLDYAILNFGLDAVSPQTSIVNKAPIFLPYINGERAPIFDSDARGMFFGIESGCSTADMAYAVLEGNAFNLYHIWETLGGAANPERIIASGGAAKNPLLNVLKASLLDVPICTLQEPDTSALGAAMIAAVSTGLYSDYEEAAAKLVHIHHSYLPDPALKRQLLPRYGIYRKLYPALKPLYQDWKEI